LFLLGWRFSPRSLLFPIGLGLLSLLSGALLIKPFIYGALLIGIGAGLAVFILQREGAGPGRGALRYLTFTILALPGLLVTHWLLERYAMTPDETGLLTAAAVLLSVSFALLLGVAPFHGWVRSVGSDSMPLAAAFVLTVGNGAAWFLLLDFLKTYSWLSSNPQFESVLFMAGVGLLLVGGLLAPLQRRLGRLMAYAAMVDTGVPLMALQLNSRLGLGVALLTLLARPFGLALMAAGVSGLRARSGGDDRLEELSGLAWKAPWSAAALVLGGVSLSGMPIGAGFAARWALGQGLALTSPGPALLIVLSGLGVMWGVWRALSTLLRRPVSRKDRPVPELERAEERITTIVLGVMIASCLAVGLYPDVLASVATALAETYTTFAP
ncbi:MAG: hypothetical protein E3J64_06720, partial [Anaerolineales bacterium]